MGQAQSDESGTTTEVQTPIDTATEAEEHTTGICATEAPAMTKTADDGEPSTTKLATEVPIDLNINETTVEEQTPPASLRTQVRSLSEKITQLENQTSVKRGRPGNISNKSSSSSGSADATGATKTQRSLMQSARSSLSSFRMNLGPKALEHNDEKQVVEGLTGLSVHAALNQHAQLKAEMHAANVNMRDKDGDRYPIHWAAARGHMRCLQALLDAGAETGMVDMHGNTPAELALSTGAMQAHNLLKNGPPLPDPKSMSGAMMQDALSLHCALNQPKELRAILDKAAGWHANPNRTDKDRDRKPIHWAAARGAIECLHALIDAGADVNAMDAKGHTAADLALKVNQMEAHTILCTHATFKETEQVARYGGNARVHFHSQDEEEDEVAATGGTPHDDSQEAAGETPTSTPPLASLTQVL